MATLRPGESRDPAVLLRTSAKPKKKPAKKTPAKPKPPAPPKVAPRAVANPNPRAALGNLYIHGGRFQTNLADAVVSADLSWSTTQVTQLAMSFADPGLDLFRSGLFRKGTAILYREPGIDVQLRISAVTVEPGPAGTGGMTIAARSSAVWKLKRRRGPKVMKKASPSQFVAAECKAAGLKAVVQPSPRRGQVARDVKGKKGASSYSGSGKPSTWTTFQRLATELGYVMFEFGGTIYFGRPTWLVRRDKTPLQVALPLPGAPEVWMAREIPTISMSDDAQVPVTIGGIQIERDRFKDVRPGGGVQLRGLPPFNDLYLTESMRLPLLGTDPLELTAMTPENPKPQPPPKPKKKSSYDDAGSPAAGDPGGGGSGDEGTEGGKTGATFVSIAVSASGARYVFGAEASSSDASPEAFDCSELVEWALARMGVSFVDGSSAQYGASNKISVSQAMGTKGALLWKPGHIGISMGDGRSVEARNPRDGVGIFRAADISWAGGGLVPGLRY